MHGIREQRSVRKARDQVAKRFAHSISIITGLMLPPPDLSTILRRLYGHSSACFMADWIVICWFLAWAFRWHVFIDHDHLQTEDRKDGP